MFHSARLQLTAWYLLIIMIISSLFSVVIYASIDSELVRIEHFQNGRIERMQQMIRDMPLPPDMPPMEFADIEGARQRVIWTLVMINGGIVVLSGAAGYFLAGRTLRPIQHTLEEQKRFVTDASHELRTPLTSLRSEIEVALRDKKLSMNNARDLLESNLEEVIRLQSLTDGLLTLATSDKNHVATHERLALALVLEESITRVSPIAKKKSISINETIQDGLIRGNMPSLVELFVILLDNAIKYSPKKSTIQIHSKKMKKSVMIQIIDQGIGIDQSEIELIFQRFYRSDKARTHTDSSGYGLGLSIARKIVLDHHGAIQVISKKGTTFTVTLPLIS